MSTQVTVDLTTMKKERQMLSPSEAEARGIHARHECMENGEWRFRLMARDGSGYIRTETGTAGAWQNSHWHNVVRETYIVQVGWIALVEQHAAGLTWTLLRPSDIHTTEPRVQHNVYMSAHSVVHTIKHGPIDGAEDWTPAPELDAATKCITEEEILKRCQR
jgi:hypothetical protein